MIIQEYKMEKPNESELKELAQLGAANFDCPENLSIEDFAERIKKEILNGKTSVIIRETILERQLL